MSYRYLPQRCVTHGESGYNRGMSDDAILDRLGKAYEPSPQISDDDLAALQGAVNHGKTAARIFREGAPAAAREIVRLASNAANERVRLDAAKYVTDRVLGRAGELKASDEDATPWAGILGAVMREPTAAERTGGARVALGDYNTPD